MRTAPALTAAAIATAALCVAGPAHAIQRYSVPTTITVTPTDGLHRGDPSGTITVTVTADPSYQGDVNGSYSCLVQHQGDPFHYRWVGTLDANGQGSFYEATTRSGGFDVTCSFKPAYQWTVLQGSISTATYTIVEP